MRTSTGEIFEVDPSGNEDLGLPASENETRLYLGNRSRQPGRVFGVNINEEPVYYEPPNATPELSE